jgi:hypothetical protein
MAEGHANGDIAAALYVTEAAVNKHVSRDDLYAEGSGHRRVPAVFAFLPGPAHRRSGCGALPPVRSIGDLRAEHVRGAEAQQGCSIRQPEVLGSQ